MERLVLSIYRSGSRHLESVQKLTLTYHISQTLISAGVDVDTAYSSSNSISSNYVTIHI